MRSLLRLSSLLSIAALFAISVSAQDFSRNFQLGPDGIVSVHNISGNVVVTGYDGNSITVTGLKKGRDKDVVQVEDRSNGARVDIRVKYPENCDCDASVDFEVRVPRSIRYNFESISSVSGNVAVSGVLGDLKARSVSGEVSVKGVNGKTNASSVSGSVEVNEAVGSVSAKSTSGEVNVVINRLEGIDQMEFMSVSGSVDVRIPANLDANVEMSVLTGDLKTDFPLQMEQKEHGPGKKAWGQVGNGSRKLRLSAVSGSIKLMKL